MLDYLRYKFSYVLDLLPPFVGMIADAYYAVQDFFKRK